MSEVSLSDDNQTPFEMTEVFEWPTFLFLCFSKKRLTEDLNSASGADTTNTGGCDEVFDKVDLREKQSMLAKRTKATTSKLGTREKMSKNK